MILHDFTDNEDTLFLPKFFFPTGSTVNDILTEFASSSGGDSAIDLSGIGADRPRLILLGFDNAFDLANDIVLI